MSKAAAPAATTLSRPAPYLAWLCVSGATLTAAWFADPYVFGLATLVAAGLSLALLVAAAVAAPRRLYLAVLAALPAMLSLVLLSTFTWA